MTNFIVRNCLTDGIEFQGLKLIIPSVYYDFTGHYFETYIADEFSNIGISNNFIQENQSFSTKGVLRGMGFQKNIPQGKLIRVLDGEIYDCVVDLRKESKTFKKWYGTKLTSTNKQLLYIPERFAHGFLVLSEKATVTFQVTSLYTPADECGFRWDDPDIRIKWPREYMDNIVISDKDNRLPFFKDIENIL
jgi:dTDP-4-dehydrorhamnose 3,5-epimerase